MAKSVLTISGVFFFLSILILGSGSAWAHSGHTPKSSPFEIHKGKKSLHCLLNHHQKNHLFCPHKSGEKSKSQQWVNDCGPNPTNGTANKGPSVTPSYIHESREDLLQTKVTPKIPHVNMIYKYHMDLSLDPPPQSL